MRAAEELKPVDFGKSRVVYHVCEGCFSERPADEENECGGLEK